MTIFYIVATEPQESIGSPMQQRYRHAAGLLPSSALPDDDRNKF
jgi:hypothetical protein